MTEKLDKIMSQKHTKEFLNKLDFKLPKLKKVDDKQATKNKTSKIKKSDKLRNNL